jgi:hypothetical protein
VLAALVVPAVRVPKWCLMQVLVATAAMAASGLAPQVVVPAVLVVRAAKAWSESMVSSPVLTVLMLGTVAMAATVALVARAAFWAELLALMARVASVVLAAMVATALMVQTVSTRLLAVMAATAVLVVQGAILEAPGRKPRVARMATAATVATVGQVSLLYPLA